MPNQALYPTPEAGAFFTFAVSEQTFTFAKSLLASGAGKLGRLKVKNILMGVV
jgi:hypothetical protein